MIRTQIYLDKDQYANVKLRANLTGKSSAEVIRTLINDGLSTQSGSVKSKVRLTDLAKLNITGGPKDLAQNLDNYLYDS